MALLGLPFWVRGGGALFRFGLKQRGAAKTLYLPRPAFQLDVGREGGGGGGGGWLQETTVVEEAEDSTALLGEGIQDETILYGTEEKSRGQRSTIALQPPSLLCSDGWFRVRVTETISLQTEFVSSPKNKLSSQVGKKSKPSVP